MADTDLIERATKAIDLFDAICNIHDPSVSAHDRRVRAMAKVFETAPSPSPAPGVVEALREKIAEIHRYDRGYSWEASDYRGVEVIHGYGPIAAMCKFILDNTDDLLASLSQPAKGEREGGGQALVDADQNVASNEAAATPANPAQVTDALDADKIATWPPLKKALWDIVTFEQLNDGHYINAYDLTDKLHFAVTAVIGAGDAEPSLLDRERAAMDVTQRRAIEGERISDAVLAWMVKYDLLDAGNEYHVSDVLAVLNDLTPSAAIGAGGQAVAPLDDDQIMEIIKEVAPWKHDPKLNDLLTYEKSPPLFPQATYDVPSYRAVNFVRAVEKRLSAIAHPVQPGWREMESAPKDGTMVRLLVRPGTAEEDGWTPFADSSEPYSAIGFNALSDTLEDEWQFAGWNWSHDCFTDGAGEVIGWMPLPAAPQPKGE